MTKLMWLWIVEASAAELYLAECNLNDDRAELSSGSRDAVTAAAVTRGKDLSRELRHMVSDVTLKKPKTRICTYHKRQTVRS